MVTNTAPTTQNSPSIPSWTTSMAVDPPTTNIHLNPAQYMAGNAQATQPSGPTQISQHDFKRVDPLAAADPLANAISD